jgi:hypothetical protein
MTQAKDTPWNSRPAVRGGIPINANAKRNRAVVQRMSDTEVATGMTADELKAFHADQKARVMASLNREQEAA